MVKEVPVSEGPIRDKLGQRLDGITAQLEKQEDFLIRAEAERHELKKQQDAAALSRSQLLMGVLIGATLVYLFYACLSALMKGGET